MNKVSQGIVFAAVMVITIVLMDILFFRHHTVPRLLANIGVVLLALAFYWRFVKHH